MDVAAIALLAVTPVVMQLPASQSVPIGPMSACGALLLAGALLTPRLVQGTHVLLSLVSRFFSVEARLANDNLPRDLGRSATSAAALMLGVAMATSFAVCVGSFITSALEWIDQSIPADLFVTSAARFGGRTNMPMADGLQTAFARIDDVEAVERVRVASGDYLGVPIAILSTDIAVFERRSHLMMLEGEQREAFSELRQGRLVVSENFARRFGVHKGDQIKLSTRRGTRAFQVAGVDIDYTNDLGTVLMDRALYVENWGDERVDTYKIYVRRGRDAAVVRRRINQRFGEAFDLFVLTNREFKASVLQLLDQVFAIVRALDGVALIIAVLGVVNALFASVLDRVREIGVLRAVGMLRRQTRNMILVEGALIGLAGTAGGLLVGLLLGQILITRVNLAETGWYFPYRPSWLSIAGSALAVIGVSALAAFYPARDAAALVVADALEYE